MCVSLSVCVCHSLVSLMLAFAPLSLGRVTHSQTRHALLLSLSLAVVDGVPGPRSCTATTAEEIGAERRGEPDAARDRVGAEQEERAGEGTHGGGAEGHRVGPERCASASG